MKKILLVLIAPFVIFTAMADTISQEEADGIVLEYLSKETRLYTLYIKEGVQKEMIITSASGELIEINYWCWVYYVRYTDTGQDCYLIVKWANGRLLEVKAQGDTVPDDLEKWVKHIITGGGKICFYNGYLYISEPEKGIHIIDNRNPSNPHAVGFVKLPGNADLAIRNDLLYADAFTNLVWFDISNPAKPKQKGILEDVFLPAWPIMWWGGDMMRWNMVAATNKTTGVNGSMSRFGLYKDYLYVALNSQLSIFDLSGETPQKAVENRYIGWNVETIFSYKENLFFGTPTGLLIYSVADPLDPKFCSAITHAFGCDPVVVENDLAYVTIHSGNTCGQNNNDLIVVDVSNVYAPRELASYAMTKPKGLGIDNGTLFLCDDGLKIFKADNPQTIIANQLAHYTGMEGYDVIPFNNVLMMVAEDGLHQYDYSDLRNIRKLSVLRFGK
jgi:hypothetical protein